MKRQYTEQDIKELKESFDEWFRMLLHLPDSSCLYRDVLRQSKNNLWQSWQDIQPVWLSSDIEESKEYAEKMAKVFEDE